MAQPKELPHDQLAEKSLLSCLLIDGSSIDEISDLSLQAEDFYHPRYGQVFDVIKELSRENHPIDYVTVCSKFKDKGKLEGLGGQTFILELTEDQATSAHIYHYARVVKEKSSIRRIIRAATKVVEAGTNFSGDVPEFLGQVEEQFFQLTTDAKIGQLRTLESCLKENLEDISNPDNKPGQINGIPTGITELDKKLLGMRAGQLIILAARPGMGKTALGVNMAVHAAKTTDLPVVIFSLEMFAQELSMRILSSETGVSSNSIKSLDFSPKDLREISKTIPKISQYPIHISDSSSVSIFDIQSQCRKLKSQYGLGLVVVDYIQLMRPHNGKIPREQQISEISRGLKHLSKEMECPVIALSQLNRSAEARTDKRPMVSDLRESGSLEQDADVVMLIYRDDYYNPDSREKGIAEINIAKNRSGEQGLVKSSWTGHLYRFSNLEIHRDPPLTRINQ